MTGHGVASCLLGLIDYGVVSCSLLSSDDSADCCFGVFVHSFDFVAQLVLFPHRSLFVSRVMK